MLKVIDLELRFTTKTLFKNVNLEFSKDNCYGIIGANGAGKSTFLKILDGRIEPTNGEIILGKGERISTLVQNHNLYDNYKVIVNERVGGDYGAEVRYRKNMDGIQCEISMENVVTRIVPVAYNGYTIGGNSGYVDSANIDKYAKVYTKEIRFEDVKMEEDAQEDDEENGTILCKSQEEMDQALTTRCEEQFSAGIDLPEVSIKVSVIDLENTEEYKEFSDLVKISLGDTVKCYNTKLDITTEARCIGMVWDCIRDTVDSVTLGDYQTNFIKQMTSTIERIASVFRNNGTLMADKISGVLDAMQTQL